MYKNVHNFLYVELQKVKMLLQRYQIYLCAEYPTQTDGDTDGNTTANFKLRLQIITLCIFRPRELNCTSQSGALFSWAHNHDVHSLLYIVDVYSIPYYCNVFSAKMT